MISVTMAQLLEAKKGELGLKLLSGEGGLKNRVSVPRVQKPGLALAGFLEQVHPYRVQVIGKTEIAYMKTLPKDEAVSSIARLCDLKIASFILTSGLAAPEPLLVNSNQKRIPLFRSPLRTAPVIRSVTAWLEDMLAPTTTLHGVLVEVLGIGILILGKSGIGKSELALDLINRGHRLVADDVVEIKKVSPSSLVGSGTPLLHHHMEAGLDVVFRVPENSATAIRQFWNSEENDLVVTLFPSERTLADIAKENPELRILPRAVRLVKYQIASTTFCLLTTLIDSKTVPLQALMDFYHARWGVEELYKISKRLFVIEDFHAKFERGVKQELFAQFALITINRLFANQADLELNVTNKSGLVSQPSPTPIAIEATTSVLKTNFKNCLHVIARQLEPLFLFHKKLVDSVQKAFNFIVRHSQRVRPGRSYPRKSMRPESKWRPSKKKHAAKLGAAVVENPA
jgi:serine kinase of HPr protein (carbohydrate metabolism regulator)